MREAAKIDMVIAQQFVPVLRWDDVNISDENIGVFALSSEKRAEFIEEYYMYEMSNLVADTGGYMGLFLGASILSTIELILSMLKIIFKK